MYGTVARFKLKPGAANALVEHLYTFSDLNVAGFISEHVYIMDNEPDICYMTALFESKAAYDTNATSPQMHTFYLKIMEHVDGEIEWHDGEVIFPRG